MARGIARGLTWGKAQPDLDERLHDSRLKRYLLADEVPIIAQHQHWAALWKPIALVVAWLFVVVLLNILLPPSTLTDLLWWALLALVGWAVWSWFEWKRKWLVATDKRLLVNYGLINQGVVMVSLARVVDLTYNRTRLGQLLRYGELERESQKHPDSMHKIKWVKDPDSTYLTICSAIFNLQDRMFGMDDFVHQHRIDDVPPPHAPGLYAGNVSPSQRPGPAADEDIDSEGIQIHYGVSRHYDRDPWHLSADLRDSSLRDADTGPIPYRRSATDEGEWQSTTTDKDHDKNHHKDHDHDPDHDPDHGQDQHR